MGIVAAAAVVVFNILITQTIMMLSKTSIVKQNTHITRCKSAPTLEPAAATKKQKYVNYKRTDSAVATAIAAMVLRINRASSHDER